MVDCIVGKQDNSEFNFDISDAVRATNRTIQAAANKQGLTLSEDEFDDAGTVVSEDTVYKFVVGGKEYLLNWSAGQMNNIVKAGNDSMVLTAAENINNILIGGNKADNYLVNFDADSYKYGTVIKDLGNNDKTDVLTVNDECNNLKVFFDMSVTVKDGLITSSDFNGFRVTNDLAHLDDTERNFITIASNPSDNMQSSVEEMHSNDDYYLTNFDEISSQTVAWMNNKYTGMADGTYSSCDVIKAGGVEQSVLLGYAEWNPIA